MTINRTETANIESFDELGSILFVYRCRKLLDRSQFMHVLKSATHAVDFVI
jgi:hypothetical protein